MQKKIVILSAFLTPFRSGAEACAEEVSALLKDRYDITIVTARLRKDLPYLDCLEGGVKVRRVGIGSPVDKWLYPFLAPFAVRALKPDIVHAILESFAGIAMVFCRLTIPSAKRILTCQSTNTTLLISLMHKSAHKITGISNILLRRATWLGRPDAVLIPNGIRLNELTGIQRERVKARILFVGRLEPMKGVDDLIETFKIVQKKYPQATLRIVGDGSMRARLEKMAEGIQNVTFVGPVSHQQVAEEYASAEIFCGLSTSEAFGNVFAEAQAAGCAVVATCVGGIPDLVRSEVTGMLVPPREPREAAKAIEQVLGDEALRNRLGEAGRAQAVNYDWKRIAEQYHDLYKSL